MKVTVGHFMQVTVGHFLLDLYVQCEKGRLGAFLFSAVHKEVKLALNNPTTEKEEQKGKVK